MFSYKTLTYGRVHLLEEALNSFLLQDFDGDSEMIIVNDYPLQKLIFDHPKVKIFNLDKTFPIIGQKENFAIEQCSGDIIVTGDDDDIALPNHFKNIEKFLTGNTWKDPDLLLWRKAVYYNEPGITAITDVGNSGFIFNKKAWERVGKSPIENAGGDMTFVNKLREGKVVHAYPLNEEVSWFYRWSLPMCYHSSGQGTDVPGRKNIVQRNSEYIEQQRKLGNIPTGEIILKPKWRHNYIKMLKDFNNK